MLPPRDVTPGGFGLNGNPPKEELRANPILSHADWQKGSDRWPEAAGRCEREQMSPDLQ